MPQSILLLVPLWLWTSPSLRVEHRHISQLAGDWEIHYRLKYSGPPTTLTLPRLKSSGTFSNSSLRGHSVPVALAYDGRLPAEISLSKSCKEIVTVHASRPSVIHGQSIELTLSLQHDDPRYARTDPLLGHRDMVIWLTDDLKLIDSFDLDGDTVLAEPELKLAHADDHSDDGLFRSAPTSLVLSTEVSFLQFLRFDDVPVRPATRMRLSFWYMISQGNAGECRVRVVEYFDKPNGYFRQLDPLDHELSAREAPQGQWLYFEYEWETKQDTNTIAVDFRLLGVNVVGGFWVDDWKLEYVGRDDSIKRSR